MSYSSSLPRNTLFRQIVSAITLAVGVVISLILFWCLGVYMFSFNRILPGVSLNGTSLAGMTVQEAANTINATYSFPQTGHLLLKEEQLSWLVIPSQLGIYLDAQASAKNALAVGRSHSLWQRLSDLFQSTLFGYAASPSFVFDQRVALQYLNGLASQIDQPLKEAGLSIENAEVTVNQGQPGRVLDLAASLGAISQQVEKMQDGVVTLVVSQTEPKVMDVTQQGELAKSILSQSLTLILPDGLSNPAGPWVIAPVDLARLLIFAEGQDGEKISYQVTVNKPLMSAYLKSIEKEINQDPQNTRFIFNDNTHLLDLYQNAVVGRTLNIDSSVSAINDSLLKGEHTVALQLTITQPQVTDTTTGADLGITELVQEYTSYFRGSSDERVQNIKTAAERFKGLLIAPGQVVSMSDILGNISLDNGYAEAPIIYGDQTIAGVGGGVCQVSTTLFRTAFFAGFPINERNAHAYRVGYYEQTASSHDQNLAGLDATVFVPLVDFKFTNDTPYWLLMETYVSTKNYSLTWKFYSTSDGRVVDWNTTGPTDIVDAPDPLYRENPDLAAGVKKQVDYSADGATVTVDRTVTRNGTVIANDHFVTHYQPWQAIWEYGPGTEGIPTPTPTP